VGGSGRRTGIWTTPARPNHAGVIAGRARWPVLARVVPMLSAASRRSSWSLLSFMSSAGTAASHCSYHAHPRVAGQHLGLRSRLTYRRPDPPNRRPSQRELTGMVVLPNNVRRLCGLCAGGQVERYATASPAHRRIPRPGREGFTKFCPPGAATLLAASNLARLQVDGIVGAEVETMLSISADRKVFGGHDGIEASHCRFRRPRCRHSR
jgi:hypothetical protein